MLYIGVLFIGLIIGFFIGYVFTEGLHVCDYCHRKGLMKFYRMIKINNQTHLEKICRKCSKENKWYTILDFDKHLAAMDMPVPEEVIEEETNDKL